MPKDKPIAEQDPRAESFVDVPASPAEALEPATPAVDPANVAVAIVESKTAPPAEPAEDAPEFIVLTQLEFDTDDGLTVGYERGAVVRDIPKRSQAWLKRDGHIAKYDADKPEHRDLQQRWAARQPKPKKGAK